MTPKYCYWSVATGEYGALMEVCVRTARAAGVFKEFHVLTDRPLAGCECYDAFQCDKSDGLFKLHYLKAGMTQLNFAYFIWLDADTVFQRNPVNVLAPLGKSPIHVPLEVNLSALTEDRHWKSVSCLQLREFLQQEGLVPPVYSSRSAFWIIQHEAIEQVYDLALRFWHRTKDAGLPAGVDAALSFAMQLLCADPAAHATSRYPELWGSAASPEETQAGAAEPEQRPAATSAHHNGLGCAILHWSRRRRTSRPAFVPERQPCDEGVPT